MMRRDFAIVPDECRCSFPSSPHQRTWIRIVSIISIPTGFGGKKKNDGVLEQERSRPLVARLDLCESRQVETRYMD